MLLLPETEHEIVRHNKVPDENVRWVGSKNGKYAMSWEEFAAIAVSFEYENRSGRVEVAEDLVVVGDDWWLERREYNGDEWWEFKSLPTTSRMRPFTNIYDYLA